MAKVIVYHREYGCDSGCCGHVVELGGKTRFQFNHPYGDAPKWEVTPEVIKQFVIDMVTEEFGVEHVKDIDWDNCVVSEN